GKDSGGCGTHPILRAFALGPRRKAQSTDPGRRWRQHFPFLFQQLSQPPSSRRTVSLERPGLSQTRSQTQKVTPISSMKQPILQPDQKGTRYKARDESASVGVLRQYVGASRSSGTK